MVTILTLYIDIKDYYRLKFYLQRNIKDKKNEAY